jgi:anaerobic selenocysteine-containing dehydrogenase/1-acyl-sn-glycerol-3-phosphate acyltransferase
MAVQTRKSYCRICSAFCAMEVDVEAGRVMAVRGDASDPVTGGYTCVKGRQLPHQIHGPQRLRSSLARRRTGGFEPIATERALDAIAQQLERIIERHGPRAVASYSGTAAFMNPAAVPVARAWHQGIGSSSNYSTLTIDQPAKIIAAARHGVWGGGGHTFASADVALSIGGNPLVSGLTLPGAPPGTDPVKSLNHARKRGLKLICVDPRRSELARRADLHLQIRPGEDPTLLAGMLRVILEEELHDQEFCREHTDGFEELRAAVLDFTPECVERRTGVAAERMVEAARLFATGPRGYASSGTGPDMAPRPCLTEHLICCLNTVCGRHSREGERLANPGVLSPPLPRPAQPIPSELLPPLFSWGKGPESRFRGLRQLFEEMPTTTLAEEILQPGEGRIRALLCIGGNPALAVPDQRNMLSALDDLELLVCAEITLSETARRADYVIAARHPFEREDVTAFMDSFYEVPYGFYTKPVIQPDFEAIEDWELFLGLAKRMKTPIELSGGAIDPEDPPGKLEVLKRIHPSTRVPLERLRETGRGSVFEEAAIDVAPPLPGVEARLQLAPEGVCEELRAVREEPLPSTERHLLICRRQRHAANSVGQDFPESRKIATTNPAFLNPADLERLGVEPGALVEIESEHDRILAVAEPSDDLQSGVVSMAHCWGAGPERDAEVRTIGSNTGRLVATNRHYDPITGMARQSAIPVTIRVAREDEAPKRGHGGILRSLVGMLASRVETKTSDDPFGRDAHFMARVRPLIKAVNLYFGTEVRGFENLPKRGGCLIVGNHSGGAETTDLWLLLDKWIDERGPEARIYALAYDPLFSYPGIAPWLRKLGILRAGHADARRALEGGAPVVVFPGGDHELSRPWNERNLIEFGGRTGFIELAISAGVPVVPMTIHGVHQSTVTLTRGSETTRWTGRDRLHVKVFPFIWNIPLGLTPAFVPSLQLPAKVTVQIGEPLAWSRHRRDQADDPDVLQSCYDEITDVMQRTLDDLAAQHPHPILTRLNELRPSRLIRRLPGPFSS